MDPGFDVCSGTRQIHVHVKSDEEPKPCLGPREILTFAFTFTLSNHIHSQLGRQLATSLNSTGIWIYERAALRPVERQGGTQSTLSHQRPSVVISGHQHSHSHSVITFTVSSDASRRLRSTRPVFGFMREQRSDRSNDRGALSPHSVISGHQWSSAVISIHIHTQ